MSPTIEINDNVKKKLDEFKERCGSETYSDTVNICLIQLKLLEENYDIIKEKDDAIDAQKEKIELNIKNIREDLTKKYKISKWGLPPLKNRAKKAGNWKRKKRKLVELSKPEAKKIKKILRG